MYVTYLAADGDLEVNVTDPGWDEIEQAIRRLDGIRNTEVMMSMGGGEHYLLVSNGCDGHYHTFTGSQDIRTVWNAGSGT
ncbi:MAG: hypothetical protein ABIY70_03165 [Capsulimonas sp.]|uniref:hypothetical protein n=1 Tax=Capsulimonas sp. TaxID=2494211 RepID=UPI0032669D72